MNKTKLTLAVTGGAMGVLVLAMGFLAWRAYTAKTVALEGDEENGIDGLETVVSRAQALMRKSVYPNAANVTGVKSNQSLIAAWKGDSRALACRGDRAFEKTTAAAFKAFLVADSKRVQGLAGGVSGHLASPDFAFGPFKDYITEGKMPAEGDLASLQRRWDDVATVAELLSKSGVTALTDIEFKNLVVQQQEETGKNKKAKKAKKAAKKAEPLSSPMGYVFTVSAKPSALVKAINALATADRFMVVDDFSFHPASDAIAEKLGGEEKKADAPSGRSSRRRRSAQGSAEANADEQKPTGGVVTDPQLDAPLTVVLSVVVHDFRSQEEKAVEESK